jgi:NhaA family Na+:H+ antiporter
MRPLLRFLRIEAASGVVLIVCMLAALVLANSAASEAFHQLWETPIGLQIGELFSLEMSLYHWVNDGLMTIFFFVVGLEIKREFVLGELSDRRRATLPIAAAFGGMVAPAGIYLMLQLGEPGERGWGIPMATDIAFVVGVMALLGPRMPHGLKVMLLALAIVDDIGAVLVIAVGYTDDLNLTPLLLAAGGFLACVLLNRAGVRTVFVYAVVGVLIWYGFVRSGVHSTVSGVLLGLLTPASAWVGQTSFFDLVAAARDRLLGGSDDEPDSHDQHEILLHTVQTARETVPPLERLELMLHPWVAFLIMPIFALANAGVHLDMRELGHPVEMAVMLGLLLGKPIGIVLFSWLFVRIGLASLPNGVHWPAMVGAGFLGGIGFTMALFIASLALGGEMLDAAKIGILSGSLLASIVGSIILVATLPSAQTQITKPVEESA